LNGNDYVLYEIKKIEEKEPNLNDTQTKNEIIELVYQKNKFDYNRKLLDKIQNKKFKNDDFLNMRKDTFQTTTLNSIKDNKKFEINAVEVLYSLPINTFTLINDEKNDIYLAKIKEYQEIEVDNDSDEYKRYIDKQSSNSKNTLLKSYDLFLNEKYNVILNQKTIERVKNYFQ